MSESNIPRVFIVQDNSRMDFQPAEDFGTIDKVIFQEHTQVWYETEGVSKIAEEALEGFTQDDFLLCAGDYMLVGLCMGIAARMIDGSTLNTLKFNRRELSYVHVMFKNFANLCPDGENI